MCESGGNCLKYLKRVWNRKEGRKKYSKKGRSGLGQGVDALNRGGRGGWAGTLLQTIWCFCREGLIPQCTL